MSTGVTYFLLIFDPKHRSLRWEDLGYDAKAAAERYSEVEEDLGDGYEVVLIGADSLETIRTTHAHYFAGEGNGDLLSSELLASTR
jgi:hypothetical protein